MFVDGHNDWNTKLVAVADVFAQVAQSFAQQLQIFLQNTQCN